MRIGRHIGLVIVLAVATTAPAGIRMSPLGWAATPADARAAMSHTVSIDLDDAPLDRAISELAERGGVNIYVNWAALEAAGIVKDASVDLHVQRATVERALELLLHDAGDGQVKLGYVVDGAVVRISTADLQVGRLPVHVYDVRDLLAHPRRPEILNLTDMSVEEREKALAGLIEETVMPDTWEENGGEAGRIVVFAGWLIVRHTPDAHKQVMELLSQLGRP